MTASRGAGNDGDGDDGDHDDDDDADEDADEEDADADPDANPEGSAEGACRRRASTCSRCFSFSSSRSARVSARFLAFAWTAALAFSEFALWALCFFVKGIARRECLGEHNLQSVNLFPSA